MVKKRKKRSNSSIIHTVHLQKEKSLSLKSFRFLNNFAILKIINNVEVHVKFESEKWCLSGYVTKINKSIEY